MKMRLLILLLMPALAFAKPWWLRDSNAREGEFLQPDEAFKVTARVDGELLRVHWVIAEGYYLYRSKFDISAESPNLTLDRPVFPDGTSKTDQYFGTQEIYQHEVEAVSGFKRGDGGAHPLQVKVTYQGCAEAGLCYPPIIKVLFPESTTGGETPVGSSSPVSQPVAAAVATPPPNAAAPQYRSAQAAWLTRLAALGGVAAFFLAGLARSRRTSATAL